MMVCLSIRPQRMSEAVALLRRADRGADIVEVRVDDIHDLDLDRLLRKPRPRVIITNRRKDEGGSFDGSASDQISILAEAARLGAEFVDIEFRFGGKAVKELISRVGSERVICSHHDFVRTPANLVEIYDSMRQTGASVFKIVSTARDIADNKKLFDLLRLARRRRQPMIAFAMSEKGEIGRILGGTMGAYLSYASRSAADCTAPGQLTLDQMIRLYRVNRLNRDTKVFGLIGNPVKQSRGIFYHNEAFRRKGANAVYVNLLVDDLKGLLEAFADIFTGYSVTMPFKQAILPHLKQVDPAARALGVVNTVIKCRGGLAGSNTDLLAVLSLLKRRVGLKGKQALILGAGATARTMAFAASSLGARVTIAGRNPVKTEYAAGELGADWTTFEGMKEKEYDLVMNATPVGMSGQGHPSGTEESIVPASMLKHRLTVFDAVCNPPITPLIRAAKRAHCRVITGTEFYLTQARLQSRIFTDQL